MDLRIGHGFDFHRLVPDRELWLGGVLIPYGMGLSGHSDADVLIHAVCDALLGAMTEGDIGRHFPDTDERYRNIDSRLLLQKVSELMAEKGWRIMNLDTTLILEAPRIAPYIESMRKSMASVLDIDPGRVSVKATTTEGLGPEGRGEGISAHAVVLLDKR